MTNQTYDGTVHPRDVDWSRVDWIKSNVEIAEETGVRYDRIWLARRLFSTRAYKIGTRKSRNVPWENLDWSKPDCTLAREHKTSPGRVCYYRKLIGKPFEGDPKLYNLNTKVGPDKVASADWVNRRDVDLAREWGITRERVRQLREQSGHPRCRWHHRGANSVELLKWLEANKTMLEGASFHSIISMMPGDLCDTTKERLLRHSGILFAVACSERSRTVFHRLARTVNWQLPNRDIELIWGTKYNAAASTRYRLATGKPRWYGKHTGGAYRQDPAYVAAVTAEIVKAEAAGVKVPADMLARLTRTAVAKTNT